MPNLNELMASAVHKDNADAVKQLLRDGVKPNYAMSENSNRTFLTFACLYGHMDAVRALVEGGAHVNRRDKFKDTSGNDTSYVPLMAACNASENAAEIAAYLISRGAHMAAAHPPGRDGAIHFAVRRNYIEIVRMLLQHGVDVNAVGANGYTPLTLALSHDRTLDTARMLLDAGAKIRHGANHKNPLFELIAGPADDAPMALLLIKHGAPLTSKGLGNALYAAAWHGKTKITETLLAQGLPVDSVNYNGEENAVIAAMAHQHYDTVKLLLLHGADPDSKERFEGSLLKQAVKSGDPSLVQLILEKRRGKHRPDTHPQTGVDVSQSGGALVTAAEKGDLPMVRLLVESGIAVDDPDAHDAWGSKHETPLMKAAAFGKIDVIRYLIEHGADVDARDTEGSTPVMYAAATGEREALRLLLDHGADIGKTNDLNWNALMQACFRGRYDAAELLLERGSPTDTIDFEKGATAMSLAKLSGNAKLIELLRAKGAEDNHYIDTEDSIGGAGPICSHHLLRYNILYLHDVLSKIGKTDERAEAVERYLDMMDSFQTLIHANHRLPPYVLSFVIESLNDHYILKQDWPSIEALLRHPDRTVSTLILQDLLYVFGEE
ncbi:MAG: ankyrin repeat domain-containing protein, partial [Spirochaetia bacterium]|nr:ankyrin repeat domain-containing protein [Spirochaetia bacterium]